MNSKFLPFALALLLAPAVFAQDYPIHLVRPLKAGDQEKISVTAKTSQSTTQSLDGAPPQEQKLEGVSQLDGTEKVIAVDANGKETNISLTVDKFTQTIGSATSEVVPGGTVIACSVADKKQVYTIDGKPVDAAVAQALDMVVDLSHGQHTDDEIFGTTDRKKKGDSWDANAAIATSDLKASGGGAEFTDIAVKTTLDDVADDALKISARITGKIKPPLPPEITVDDSTFDAKWAGTFPTDTTKYKPDELQEMVITFSAHADGPSGQKVVIKSTVDQSVTRKTTPVN